ncbi:MAG: ricin-type beta-trefoil lectin domain protein [Chloroflexi bacterium]|nr:ricin-type beta-trefoil lectin domain protein [Chloroflexota bacterium]
MVTLVGVSLLALLSFGGRASAFSDQVDILVAQHSGKCMDVTGASTQSGANIIQYTCHGGANQSVSIEDMGGGLSRIRFMHSLKCLDIGEVNGQLKQQWCSSSNNDQKFQLASPGNYGQIYNPYRNLCVDVRYAGTDDLEAVIPWSCNGQSNQSWLTRDLYTVGMAPATGHWAQNIPPNPDNPNPAVHHLVSCEPFVSGVHNQSFSSGYCNGGGYPDGPGGDWATDYYAYEGTSIKFGAVGIGTPGANVTAQVWAITQTCSAYSRDEGGSTVFVDVYTNGRWEGWYAFGHLNNVAVQPGQWIGSNTSLGASEWWTGVGGCYQVGSASGVHVHIEMWNTDYSGTIDGYACYRPYNFYQSLNTAFPLGDIGRTIYQGLRSQC